MISAQKVQAVMQQYIERVDAVDVDAILELYADDAQVEDPVGAPVHRGKAAIEAFYRKGLTGAKMRATLQGPVRASDAGSGAIAFRVDVLEGEMPGSIDVIDVMEFNEKGQIRSMKAYWGPLNFTPAQS
ncbi:nuclear transport factor 2 family protein [Marinobacterium stanieri]|uniref:Steroid delta-isomerase n=1 Tax=Marinobacterium stanieri TaxID=49186 RepID=A0A1N6P337_9GAMM|nr:nuclear transport factor 2 family protein [Marinobacterium stanieri]SIP98552.1 steroid delta-isomerase [Marinobacterium stanieri]